MAATVAQALYGSSFARLVPKAHSTEVPRTFCGVAVVCIALKVLMTLARGLQRKIRPWIRADDERVYEVHRLRRSSIVAETARPVTGSAPLYDTYGTEEDEQKYWEEAARGLRELQDSDAKYTAEKSKAQVKPVELPPLVMYYTPALPRYQRTKEERRRTPLSHKQEMRHRRKMTPEIYIKWHWMTHPEAARLTEVIAQKRIEAASGEELREIYRLSKKLPDDHEIFRCTDLRSKKEVMTSYNWRHFFSWYGAFKRREEDETEGLFVFDKKASWATRPLADDDDDEREKDLLDGHRRPGFGSSNPFDYGDDSSESGDFSNEEYDSLGITDDASSDARDFRNDACAKSEFTSNISGHGSSSTDQQDDSSDDGCAADETEEDLESQFADWTFSNVSIY